VNQDIYPKYSVCISTYNQALYLEKSIFSAINQHVPPHEIIVVNDCSTDNTKEILDKLVDEIPNLKVYHQQVNVGISKNVDRCFRMVSTEYVIRLDSDDVLLPEFAEFGLQEFMKHSHVGYVHTAVQEIDLNDIKLKKRILSRNAGFQNDEDALKAAVKGFKVAANILMFSMAAIRKVDYVKSKSDFTSDFYFVSSISAAGYGNVYIPQILAYYRVWNDDKGFRKKRKLDEIKGVRMVIDEILKPAYKEKNWSLIPINQMKMHYAKRNADCLGWSVYSSKEKKEIRDEIVLLSSSIGVQLYVWIYQNNYGFLLSFMLKLERQFKFMIKSIFFKIQESSSHK
jgi:hypothetical protein